MRDLLGKPGRRTADDADILLLGAVRLAALRHRVNMAEHFLRAIRHFIPFGRGSFAGEFDTRHLDRTAIGVKFLMTPEVTSFPTSLQASRITPSTSSNEPVIFTFTCIVSSSPSCAMSSAFISLS